MQTGANERQLDNDNLDIGVVILGFYQAYLTGKITLYFVNSRIALAIDNQLVAVAKLLPPRIPSLYTSIGALKLAYRHSSRPFPPAHHYSHRTEVSGNADHYETTLLVPE